MNAFHDILFLKRTSTNKLCILYICIPTVKINTWKKYIYSFLIFLEQHLFSKLLSKLSAQTYLPLSIFCISALYLTSQRIFSQPGIFGTCLGTKAIFIYIIILFLGKRKDQLTSCLKSCRTKNVMIKSRMSRHLGLDNNSFKSTLMIRKTKQ